MISGIARVLSKLHAYLHYSVGVDFLCPGLLSSVESSLVISPSAPITEHKAGNAQFFPKVRAIS